MGCRSTRLLIELLLSHREAGTVRIAEAFYAMDALHAFDVARIGSVAWGKGKTTGMAQAVHPWFQLMVESNALVEDKTLPVPTGLLFWDLLEIFEDAAAEVVHLTKSMAL